MLVFPTITFADESARVAVIKEVKVSELIKSVGSISDQTSRSILRGKTMITIAKKLAKDAKFEIKTPTAVMGVRGTTFEVVVTENKTYTTVFEGLIHAITTDGVKEAYNGPMQTAVSEQLLRDPASGNPAVGTPFAK